MRWMATTVLACMGAGCTVDATGQADSGICVDGECSAASDGSSGGADDDPGGEVTGGPITTGANPDGAGPCASEYAACVEEGWELEICDDLFAECEGGSSGSRESGSQEETGKPGEPGSDGACEDLEQCCVDNGSSAASCTAFGDACDGVNECEGDTACHEAACIDLVDACRPPNTDPFKDPCADALLHECGIYVHGCLRIFGTPTPQEFCESSGLDAEFCQEWIIVCETRRVTCDELFAMSPECSIPGANCYGAWIACVQDASMFDECWDALEACELDPPTCPEGKGGVESEPCTCADQLETCIGEAGHKGGDSCEGDGDGGNGNDDPPAP